MSVDNWKQEYHLTPNGWLEGTETNFDVVQGETIPRPDDAVETWVYQIYQRSAYSEEVRSFVRIWNKPGTQEFANRLHHQFARPVSV